MTERNTFSILFFQTSSGGSKSKQKIFLHGQVWHNWLCEQRFLSSMASNVYEVVSVACQSLPTTRLTRKRRERLLKRLKPCRRETSARRVDITVLSRMCLAIVYANSKKWKIPHNCKRRFSIYWDDRVGKSEITFRFFPHTGLEIMRKFPNPSKLVLKTGTSRKDWRRR